MTTNLDKLHKVIQAESYDRGDGRTFAACHNLAGILETAEPGALVVWVLPVYRWLDHIRPMISQVLTEHGIPFRWTKQDMLEALNKRVKFATITQVESGAFHGTDPYVVDTLGEVTDYILRENNYQDYVRLVKVNQVVDLRL